MGEDIYERFVEDIKRQHPQMKDEEQFKYDLLLKLKDVNSNKTRRQIFYLRMAASIALLLSLGAYVWMEAYTWEKRLLAEQSLDSGQLVDKTDWQCRQAVDELMTLLVSTESLTLNGRSVAISKTNLHHLRVENKDLFERVEGVLVYMSQFYPTDYAAFQAGETVQLTAWKLRKEYGLCQWITNN